MIILLAVLGALGAAPSVSPQDSLAVRPVTGHWQYNPHESDEPRRRMRGVPDSALGGMPGGMPPGQEGGREGGGREGGGSMGPGGMGGGMGGMGGMGGGGMRPRGGNAMSPEDMQRRVTLMSFAFEAPQFLDLSESDTSFSVIELLRFGPDSVQLRTNGHKLERRLDENVRVEYRARRQDGRLTVERKVGNAGKVTETYYLSPDRTQLFVLVQLEASQAGRPGGMGRGGPPGGEWGGREGSEGGERGEAGERGERGERGEPGPHVWRRVYDRVQ